ncbi:ribosome biogenesis GTPase Der [Curvivirga aplysinae]|uniref:ribosome biogenesis GTPase Der n=1 Tax=Curvivirga aplysinae TaxID=2529852 RepID=UPI0012BBDB1F|nr:ribosome biogenesis GTPase Der [Curvivirga aplysinae]MTI10022.1 ribosome biogenesis GTPase Der [Curvivirga aplysinae]
MSFTVAIVGRPNVGKSTLFNRLVGKKLAIVDDQPGVTRDRREGDARLIDLRFRVIDTAGLEEAFDDSLEGRMRRQTEQALGEADVALLLVDARAGLVPLDEHFAGFLRKHSTPVILVANKCEGKAGQPGLMESYGLGLGEPVPFSAEHGEGVSDLYEALLPYAEAHGEEYTPVEAELIEAASSITLTDDEGKDIEEELVLDDPEKPIQLAIVGRPNVGKSTLVNRLLGEDRLLTGPEAGITRDSIALDWEWQGRPIKLIDTAGLRRRGRITDKVEKLSAADTRRAIRFAQVVALVLDADDMLEKQDLTIARQVIEEGRALIIVANKWDAVKDKQEALDKLMDRVQFSMPQVRGIPIVTVSAKEGRNLPKMLKAVFDIYETWNRRVPTSRLNEWLFDMTERHPPPLSKGRRIKLRYMTQAKTRPPTFAAFVSIPEDLPDSYTRYLINGLREDFDLPGVPLRFYTRKGKNPYAPK